MKIYLASDHAGLDLKNKIKEYLTQNYEVEDKGDFFFDKTMIIPVLLPKPRRRYRIIPVPAL